LAEKPIMRILLDKKFGKLTNYGAGQKQYGPIFPCTAFKTAGTYKSAKKASLAQRGFMRNIILVKFNISHI
jgi:hypothetical protein